MKGYKWKSLEIDTHSFLFDALQYPDLQKQFDQQDIDFKDLMLIQISRQINEANHKSRKKGGV